MANPLEILKQAHQLQQRGDFAEAERLYRRVLKIDPKNIHALNLLGALCVNSRRPAEAVKFIGRSLAIRPEDPQALVNYALGLKDVGRVSEAVEALTKALKLNGANIPALNILGGLKLDAGKAGEAIAPYSKVVQIDENYADGWINLASAFKETKQYEKALGSLERAFKLVPASPRAHKVTAEVYRAQGLLEKAIEQFEQILQLHPESVSTAIQLAHTYREAEQVELALQTLSDLAHAHPGHADVLEALGLLYEQLGERDKAADSFKQAIASQPGRAHAHYQLAALKGRPSSDEEVSALERLLASENMGTRDKRYGLFALAVIRDKRRQYSQAFAAWAEANASLAEQFPYQPGVKEAYYQSLIASLSPLLRQPQSANMEEHRPVFIVGMPRSGTTLAGQILASHNDVSSMGEVGFAYDMAARVKAMTGADYPQGASHLTNSQCRDLAEGYVGRYAQVHSGSRYVLDVTPLNFQHVGLLGAVFPQAKFIYCRRDPVDTCFSIFKLPFSAVQNYAHDLRALGHQHNQICWLMREWKALMPGRILDVQYEDTVADLESQSRKMLDFLGLPFDAAVLRYYNTGNIVRTPSASQVREPIYRDAVQAWKNYESFLAPLIEAIDFDTTAAGIS